ncbi:MAG TPA: hypothetical protein VHB99_13295 [Pirellulales bacterium]|nr:hypothetical protein [Pirellulales bacterium]
MFKKLRSATAVATAAATLFAAPAQSHAIFNWFGCKCGAQPAPMAAPVIEAAPVAAPTVVNYVPQTCYRTQYVTVPVTTYRPAMGCDPCTGFPVTTMRPVIAYVQQARLVPYTTYRAVMTAPVGLGLPVMGSVGYAPSAGCSSCSAAPAAQPYYSAAPAPIAAPAAVAPIGSASPGAPTLAPTENPATSTFTQRPYIPSGPIISSSPVAPASPPAAVNSGTLETRQKPIELPKKPEQKSSSGESTDGKSRAKDAPESKAESDADSASSAPRLINPGDRTTMHVDGAVKFAVHRVEARPAVSRGGAESFRDLPARPASTKTKTATKTETTPAVSSAPLAPATPDDADGWRPSNR